MKFKKVTEVQGEFIRVYFTDEMDRTQGELCCYHTLGSEPREENLYYKEYYRDGFLTSNREYFKLLLPEEKDILRTPVLA